MKLEENIKYLDMIRDKVDASIRKGYSERVSEAFIANNLSRACADGKTFTVKYIHMKKHENTFIMRVYPDIDELKAMAKPLMEKLNGGDFVSIWSNITKWHIEIDDRILTKGTNIAVDNGSQFVAILCHEVGHTLNAFPAKLVMNYRFNKATASILDKALMSTFGRIIFILCLPMFVCINGFRIIISRPGATLNEMSADLRVPDKYKPYLIDYTNNHIIPNPMAPGIVVTVQDYDNEQKKGIEFSRSCINLMKQRAAVLKIHLATFGKLSSSPYLAQMSNMMVSELGGCGEYENAVESYKAMELFNREYDMAVAEAKKMSLACEQRIVSERDIMLLQCDIDAMETVDDKTYVLNTIFDYIESLEKNKEKAIKKIKDSKKVPDTSKLFDDKIKQLNDMKTEVMKRKISSYTNGNEYAVYVKYPKGYEG